MRGSVEQLCTNTEAPVKKTKGQHRVSKFDVCNPFQSLLTISVPVQFIIIKYVIFYLSSGRGGRRGGLIVSALSEFEPWPGHGVVFLGKTFYLHSASLHQCVINR